MHSFCETCTNSVKRAQLLANVDNFYEFDDKFSNTAKKLLIRLYPHRYIYIYMYIYIIYIMCIYIYIQYIIHNSIFRMALNWGVISPFSCPDPPHSSLGKYCGVADGYLHSKHGEKHAFSG